MTLRPLLLVSLGLLCGCRSLATGPDWVGGGMVVTGPMRPPAPEDADDEPTGGPTPDGQPSEVGARHILVMHNDSQSRPDEVDRSREEARARATECLIKLRGGADFTEMVNEYSDEPGAAARGGDLGLFSRDVMVKPFADAAFSLEVGEVSELVETVFGFHIIKRTR